MKAFWVGALGLSMLLVACSGDDHPPPLGAVPLAECSSLDHSPCDARNTACQKRLLQLAGCVYGVDTTPNVPVRVVTEEQLLAELTAAGEPGSVEEEAEAAEDLLHIEHTFASLRLLQPGDLTEGGGSTAQIVSNIDGVYQDAERGIALVDRGMPRNTAEADGLLVHEFVHAIQDAEYGLADWREQYPSDLDTALALRSVTEGQATLAQFRVVSAMSGRSSDEIDWPRTFEGFRDKLNQIALDDPSPYLASVTTFPYAFGAAIAYSDWSENGPGYHEQQFDSPVLTTFAALSQAYGLGLGTPGPIAFEAPALDADYRAVDETALGAYMLQLIAYKLDASDPLALAAAWQGDRLWIAAGPAGATAWLWEIELRDASAATELETLVGSDTTLNAGTSGNRLYLTGSVPRPFVTDAGAAFLSAAAP